jgi:hypothetical protein
MYMTDIDLVNSNNLQIGDRLVRGKGVFTKHHGVYAGIHDGIALAAECQVNIGVHYVPLTEYLKWDAANLLRIERFYGDRSQITARINAVVGTPYDLLKFNCEHFAEYIHTGAVRSKQVENAFLVLGLAALLLGAASSGKNNHI